MTNYTEQDAISYVKEKTDFFAKDAELTCKEIGDGNLNYVFRIVDAKNARSIILKQAGPQARISSDIHVSTDRNRIEYEILKLQYELAPGLVPKVYHYDAEMNCCLMEDLSDHEIMRSGLLAFKQYPKFAEHISEFLAQTILRTSDFVLSSTEKKEQVKRFINPDLCLISEDLVYTEPFFDCARNDIYPATLPYAKLWLWQDEKLLLEVAKMKIEFMTNAQSLIHGDLHTGSIFVTETSTKMIDPEFAFYGPAGYDVGNVIANLFFAYIHADSAGQQTQKDWLVETIEQTITQLKAKFSEVWDKYVLNQTKGLQEYVLEQIMQDTAGIAGLELIRRTLGLAHVKDLTTILEPAKREKAERLTLLLGKFLINNRKKCTQGCDFIQFLRESEELEKRDQNATIC